MSDPKTLIMYKNILKVTFVCILFITIGIWCSRPLGEYITTGMPYTHSPFPEYKVAPLIQGDYLQLYYYFWLFKDSVVGNTPLFTNTYEFNTGEILNKFSFQGIPISLFFFILSIFGNITGYNLLVITTFLICGLSMFLLVKHYTKNYVSGVIAGLIFALAPYRLCQVFGGHPGGFSVWLVPLIIYFLELSFDKKSIWPSLLSGICIISLGLMESHLIYYMFLFLAVFLPFRIYIVDKNIVIKEKANFIGFIKDLKNHRYLYIMVILGFFVLSFVWIYYIRRLHSWLIYIQLALIYPVLFSVWVFYSRIIAIITGQPFKKLLRQDVFTFIPVLVLPIYVIQFRYNIPGFGKYLILFVIASIFALKLIFLARYIEKINAFFETTTLSLKKYLRTLIPLLFCMSLYVLWVLWDKFTRLDVSRVGSGRTFQEVRLYSPPLRAIFSRFSSIGENFIYIGIIPLILGILALWKLDIKRRAYIIFYGIVFIVSYILVLGPSFDEILPLYRLCYYIIPLFNYSRVPARIIYMSFLALAIIAGFGMKNMRRLLGIIVPILIIIDFMPRQKIGISILPKENKVYRYIKDIGYSGNILELPIWPGDSSWSSIYEYYVTLYRIQMINGYDPTVSQEYVDNVAEALFSVNLGQFYFRQYELLKKLNVSYVLMHEEAYPEKVCPFPPSFATDLLFKSPYLDFITTDGNIYLFKLKQEVKDMDSSLNFLNNTSIVANIYEAECLQRVIGTPVEISKVSGGWAVLGSAKEGREGFLVFGPHRTYPIGKYLARFRLMASDLDEKRNLARLEIATDNGKIILNYRDIKGTDFIKSGISQDFLVPFTISQNTAIEFRVHFYKIKDIWVDCIIVSFSNQFEPLPFYEAEGLIRQTGCIAFDKDASGGKAVYGDPLRDIPVRLAQGPYRTYEAGNYKASFWLKIDKNVISVNKDLPVVLLQVASDFGKREFRRELIKLGDFDKRGIYQNFDLYFTLDSPRELDLRVTYKGNAGVWVDRIDILHE